MNVKLQIDDKNPTPIFQQIVNGFERLILTGEIPEGDFLPSVRDFALSHSINPNTVSKAYQALQTKNLVESVRGMGLKVKKLNNKASGQRRAAILEEKVSELLSVSRELKIPLEELIDLIRAAAKGVKK